MIIISFHKSLVIVPYDCAGEVCPQGDQERAAVRGAAAVGGGAGGLSGEQLPPGLPVHVHVGDQLPGPAAGHAAAAGPALVVPGAAAAAAAGRGAAGCIYTGGPRIQ